MDSKGVDRDGFAAEVDFLREFADFGFGGSAILEFGFSILDWGVSTQGREDAEALPISDWLADKLALWTPEFWQGNGRVLAGFSG